MTTRDLKDIYVAQSIAPGQKVASVVGDTVDLRGYDSAQCFVAAGIVTDGSWLPKVEESDDDSAWNDVPAAELNGAFTAITATSPEANQSQNVRYIGNKRYVRVSLTLTATASPTVGGPFAAQVLRGHPHRSVGS